MKSMRITEVVAFEPSDTVQQLREWTAAAKRVVCDRENTLFAALTAALETDFQNENISKVFEGHLPGLPKSLGNKR